nr:TIR-like protein FxsC [Streptacidiphilus carbonis]
MGPVEREVRVTVRGGSSNERPYIFLSYAHAHDPLPVPMGGDGSRPRPHPDHLVHKFFADLCALITELNDIAVAVPSGVGFMDRHLRPGVQWTAELSQALAYCRVFVPLYSPRYFRSVNCGQEWQAFSRRQVFSSRPDGRRTSAVVPVLWVPQDSGSLPKCATGLQYKHVEFGPAYAQEGMYSLARFGYLQDAYDYALNRIAREIVAVAAETKVVVDHHHGAYSALPSAFETTDASPRLRISVLAGDRRSAPPERSSSCYGETPSEWQPYDPGPDDGLSLAEHAARIAGELDFQASIHVFDDEADTVLSGSGPVAPELMLFDRWSLLNPIKRDLARKFDRVNPGWVSMLRPWCRNDPQREQGEQLLRDLEAETFASRRRGASKPSFDDVQLQLPTIETFSEMVPRAAIRAWHAYQSQRRPTSPTVPLGVLAQDRAASSKPNLSAVRSKQWAAPAPSVAVPVPPIPDPSHAGSPPADSRVEGTT